MAPEKIAAFSQAGSAASAVLVDRGVSWISYGDDIALHLLRGQAPTVGEAAAMFGRWTGLMIGLG